MTKMALALATRRSVTSTELPSEFRDFRTLSTDFDPGLKALKFRLLGRPRPCFTPEVLEELRALQRLVRSFVQSKLPDEPIRYIVGSSGASDGVNFGGDLDFFLRCIRRSDEYALAGYARMAIDLLHENLTHLGCGVSTIAVVRGPTLGAAFEAALSCDAILAESNARLGFPEVLFNLFPGMGAYQMLSRRIPPAMVERMIVTGKQYTASQFFELGIIDSTYESEDPDVAIQRFLQHYDRSAITRAGVLAMREIEFPVSKDRLLAAVDVWVDSMMRISTDQISRMESLLRLQLHRTGQPK